MAGRRGRTPSRTGGRRRASSYDEEERRRLRGPNGADVERRGGCILRLLLAGLAVVALRLVWLQVIEAPALRDRADAMQANTIALPAKRGTIYDRNGNVLATNVDCTTVYCNPTEVEDPHEAARILAEGLGGEEEDYLAALDQEATFAYLYRQADEEDADAVAEELAEAGVEGIYYLEDTKREYPYGDVANQVLGRVGVDGEGLTGIEYQYDDVLGGTDGELVMETGADGTPVAGGVSEHHPAEDGQDIVLSIDVNVQASAERTIAEAVGTYSADSGSVVVTDPQTGEILAICSTPLADFSDPETVTDESLQLKPVSHAYEPGSTIKPVTLAIGIEEGVLTPETTYTVPPEVRVGDDMVGDDDERDWTMDMTVREIMRRSSNTGAVLMAESIGADDFAAGLADFGFGEPTGVDYPGETVGIVTPRDEYTGASLGVMSFGQGISVPAVQMASAIGTIANGGVRVTPHLVVSQGGEELDWGEGERVVSEETAATVTDVLRGVVAEGTGTAGQVAGYDVAGKTGTAEMADEQGGGYVEGEMLASMIGYANADDPEVLVYVGLNGIHLLAADSAAAVFSTIMGDACELLGVPAAS